MEHGCESFRMFSCLNLPAVLGLRPVRGRAIFDFRKTDVQALFYKEKIKVIDNFRKRREAQVVKIEIVTLE